MEAHRVLYWAPRLLAMVFIAFVSLFAMDAFNEGHGFWRMMTDFGVHLTPSLFMIAALALAWKREWIGTLGFLVVGAFFIRIGVNVWVKAMFATPCVVAAILFFLSWIERRAVHRPAF